MATWRRGDVATWREGAYLYEALGRYANDEDVPSEWRMSFIAGLAAEDASVLLDGVTGEVVPEPAQG